MAAGHVLSEGVAWRHGSRALQKRLHTRGMSSAQGECMSNTSEQMAVVRPGPVWDAQLPIRAEFGGCTHQGCVRSENQDNYLIAELWQHCSLRQSSLSAASGLAEASVTGHLLAVADGMGGHEDGAKASQAALEGLSLEGLRHQSSLPAHNEGSILGCLEELVRESEARVKALAKGFAGGSSAPGTTLTTALVAWPRLYIAHVGDSRCYLLRKGRCFQLTEDHTLGHFLQRQQGAGERDFDPRFAHVLTNALGGDTEVARIDLISHELALGDIVLLCSDGLVEDIRNEELASIGAAQVHGSMTRFASDLVQLALQRGARDNVTAVALSVSSTEAFS